MPSFSKKTYDLVADMIKEGVEFEKNCPEVREIFNRLALGFASRFRRDNPAFSQDRFMKACGL